MTRDSSLSIKRSKTAADSAVDGLLAGLAGGAAMAVFLVVAALLDGAAITALLVGFDMTGASSPLLGLVTHLAVAGAYGVLLGIVAHAHAHALPLPLQAPCWLLGLTFGLITLLLSIVLPLGLPGFVSPMEGVPPLRVFIAHGLYGVVLGGLIGWRQRSSA